MKTTQVLQILQLTAIGFITSSLAGCAVADAKDVELTRYNQVTGQVQTVDDIIQVSPALTPPPAKEVKVKNKEIVIK